ncbi:unnamed protein product, partial [Scytosiphon promiscuus]
MIPGRFLADGSEAQGEEKQLWNLPLLYTTASNPTETQLEMMSGETHTLKARRREFALFWAAFRGTGNKDDWVKINAGQHTLMRVLYTPEMMKRLEAGVRDRTL